MLYIIMSDLQDLLRPQRVPLSESPSGRSACCGFLNRATSFSCRMYNIGT